MSEKQTTKPEVTTEVKSEGGDMKIKSKPKKFTATKNEPVKVDLSKDPNVKVEEPVKVQIKKQDDAIQIGETKEIPVGDKPEASKKVDGEVRVSNTDEVQKSESPIVELNKEEQEQVKKVEQKVAEAKRDEQVLGRQLPENIEKEVRRAVSEWLGYINIRNVETLTEEGDLNQIYVKIEYSTTLNPDSINQITIDATSTSTGGY